MPFDMNQEPNNTAALDRTRHLRRHNHPWSVINVSLRALCPSQAERKSIMSYIAFEETLA